MEYNEKMNRNHDFDDHVFGGVGRVGTIEHLKEIFRKNEQIYDGSDAMVNELFKSALHNNNEETMNGLIFQGSPVISYKDPFKDNTFLQELVCVENWTSQNPLNIGIAQLLIDNGINIDHQNKKGYTALHLNAKTYSSINGGQLDMTRLLLKNGANREIRDQNGLTPLQLNLYKGRLDVAEEFLNEKDKLPNVTEVERTKRCQHLVKCLLKKRNNWNIPSTNYSILLHFLTLNNDEETFEYVAKNTIFDVNALNLQEKKLMHVAAERGTPRMIRTLVNLGADPDACCEPYATPLITAIKETRTEIFHCLIDCGASVNKVEKRGETIMCENSPLQYAVCMQNLEMVERLVKMGADVNARSYHRSPLLLACGSIYSKKWSQYHDSQLEFVFYTNNSDGDYLSRTIHNFPFNVKIVEVLLNHGADIKAKNASKRTSLDQACRCGQLDIVKLLLSRGAEINKGDVSTLHHAVRGENPAVVRLILDQGADVNFRCAPERRMSDCRNDPNAIIPPPRTPLECALLFIFQDSICEIIVEILLEYGVNLNVANPETGETPLHLACFSDRVRGRSTDDVIASRPETLRFLLRHNANVNALDSMGFLPLDCVNYAASRISALRFQPDLETVIAFIAIIIATKGCVIKENLELLEGSNIQPFYQKCVKELSLMKENICESRNFSFLNALSKDIDYLGNFLKDKHVYPVLYSEENERKFPIYAEFLEDRILEALIRQRLVELAIGLFQKYVHKNFSVCVILNIFKYLYTGNLKNFVKACFVDVE